MPNAITSRGDDSVLPRSVATKAAFENAMSLDIAMGGSTNTVLHLLAVAHEAGVDFTMQDIDRLSRRVPVLCKVAPNSHYHIQDVNRAGGILSILGELARGGLLDTSAGRVDGRTLGQAIAAFDLRSETASSRSQTALPGAPAGGFTAGNWTQRTYYDTPDTDRTAGCIRDLEHAYFRDGGLAVLTGNIARRGCIVKTAGVDASRCLSSAGAPASTNRRSRPSAASSAARCRPATLLSYAMKAPRAAPGCRRCSTPRRTSNPDTSTKPAR